jgi:hypothetical protein
MFISYIYINVIICLCHIYMYKHKYLKYKIKYDQLKKKNTEQHRLVQNEKSKLDKNQTQVKVYEIIPEIEPIDYKITKNKKIDLYLFFDLLQVSKDIINLTRSNDFIILIGDTPSYLTPFLEDERNIFNLSFSNKPFGCFMPPYSFSESKEDRQKHRADLLKRYPDLEINDHDPYIPSKKTLDSYFNYLNSQTKLTKKFVKTNWKNIVLVDTSSGQSIIGVSIFLNRYIENIHKEKNEMECINIKGAQPLQFIRLDSGYNSTNIKPEIAKEYFPNFNDTRNYHPDLIVFIGSSRFLHRELFMIYEAYPRIVPFYDITKWDQPPKISNTNIFTKLKNILRIYLDIKKHETSKLDEKTIEKYLKVIKTMNPIYKPTSDNPINSLNKYFDSVNLLLLYEKYFFYFE